MDMVVRDTHKLEFIVKKINILDMDTREHIVKILLTYEVTPKQTNNGAWCRTEELSDELIEILYNYVVCQLK